MAVMASSNTKLQLLIGAYACAADPSTRFFGGGDLLAWNLVRRLGQTHRLWVLTASQNRQAIEAALKADRLPGVQFVYVDLPGWLHFLLRHQGGIQLYAYLWQWRAYFVARRLHQQVRFHAFHHLTYENDWMASIIGALLPVPYVRGPAGGAHRVPKKFRRQFPVRSHLWEYVRMALQWVFRHDPFFALGHERAKVLLMANHEALDALPARWRKKAQLLSVSGVSPSSIPHDLASTPSHAQFRLLTAGRLVPLKGFDLAVRAFGVFLDRLRREGQGKGTELRIVGDGPERSRLQELIKGLRLEDRVHMVNWMAREELFREMVECDVLLFPSLRDGGGLVVVEAMAAGKPVVCLDLGGPGLHVTEACGVKVPAHSPEQAVQDLAAALARLYLDPALRQQMGRAARQRAEQVYDWDCVSERVIEAYKQAVPTALPESPATPFGRARSA
jgi:glycosyltransferase involved in cell wall biosynthesis